MPMEAGARKSGRAIASPSRSARRPARIRKLASAIRATRASSGLQFVEASLGALLDHAFRKTGAGDVAAVTDLRAAVRTCKDRPVARSPILVNAMCLPHVEILVLTDEPRVGDALAGVTGVVDRVFEADREVERVELVQLFLL